MSLRDREVVRLDMWRVEVKVGRGLDAGCSDSSIDGFAGRGDMQIVPSTTGMYA
jgi:hypothetical protein